MWKGAIAKGKFFKLILDTSQKSGRWSSVANLKAVQPQMVCLFSFFLMKILVITNDFQTGDFRLSF